MNKLKIAIQKNGRLSERSLELLKSCGIKFSNGVSKLKADALNFPLEVLFLRDDDIPQYVEQGVADIGIVGENVLWENNKHVAVVAKLGFARCRMSLAIPKDELYSGLSYFNNIKIATSYPKILQRFCEENDLNSEIEEIGGSVEIAPGIGLANAVFDIVSSGSTLLMNGLKEVAVVAESEAVLIANGFLTDEKQKITNQLIFRIQAVKQASENKYILLNTPNDAIDTISQILPGIKSPTILPLARSGWSSLHSVIKEDEFWDVIGQLKAAGAEGILVIPIEKMIS